MADFVPESSIYFFKGTKVTLQNQPFFTSQASKLSWYLGHDSKVFSQYSYQRENRQWVRVEAKAEEMRGYDMMAFRNSADSKVIFCRVVEVEFINPNTTQVTFETDSMQTFIEDIEWGECWVEREMVKDDWNGSIPSYNNLMPEGLETGPLKDILLENPTNDIIDNGYSAVVLSAYDSAAEPNIGMQVAGPIFSTLNQFSFNRGVGLADFLTTYATKGRLDGIAGIWIVPSDYVNTNGKSYNVTLPTEIDGYQPKNAKCLTGEFCYITLSNRQGQVSNLYPQNFLTASSGIVQFVLYGGFLFGGGGVTLYPSQYMDKSMGIDANNDYGVVLPFSTQMAYVSNAYANWVASNKGTLLTTGLASIATIAAGAVGVVSANPAAIIGAGFGLANNLMNTAQTLGKVMDVGASPLAASGQNDSGMLLMLNHQFGFTIVWRCPTVENLKAIDDFFTVYGYRTCRAKKPNVDTRPFWNYVKCAPAIVGGPFTSRDKQNIEASLNAGVTFWHVEKGATIGDYSKDNRG